MQESLQKNKTTKMCSIRFQRRACCTQIFMNQIWNRRQLVGTPLEGEHLHPYTLGTVSEDKCHGKEQIYTRAKDPDRTGINQDQHIHGRAVPQVQRPPPDVSYVEASIPYCIKGTAVQFQHLPVQYACSIVEGGKSLFLVFRNS